MMSSIEPSRRHGALYVAAMKRLPLLGCILVLAACSPAPMPVSQSKNDPSNPFAPEGATSPIAPAAVASSTSGSSAAPPDSHRHHHHGSAPAGGADASAATTSAAATDAGTVYVCPMHPEVTSNGPGLCPKCNMKLVPKK
jgi:hypothetical protein